MDYLTMKVLSFETYFWKFLQNSDKKYKITNKESKKNIYIENEHVILDDTKYSEFFITHKLDMMHRINIKYNTNLPNINRDKTGWNLYTTPSGSKMEGKGNNDIWGQFYIIPSNEYFYLISYHLEPNKKGMFGRHVGVIDNNLVTDLDRCNKALWIIEQL